MGKKNKIIPLSEVDHKLQFISVVAVIGDITPTIYRNKLTKVEVSLLDETVKKPGFNVKLTMQSKILNQFLNVAKRGFIIQLCDIKVIKNEGEVYGEVQEEEEIALYNDRLELQKWYPDEKATVTDAVKMKIQSMIKWKKVNLKDIEMLPEDNKDTTKSRRNLLILDEKSQLSPNVLRKISPNRETMASKKAVPKVKEHNQKVKDNLPSPENKLNDSHIKKNEVNVSVSKNETTNNLRRNKSLMTYDKTESPSTRLSRSGVSPTPSRLTRTANANLSKSSSLSSLKKLIPSGTLRKSTSSLNKSYISSEDKTTSILNNPAQINLKGSQVLSRSKKLKIDENEKREKGESDSENSTPSKRLRNKSKNTSSSDSHSNEDNSMVAKKTNCNKISTANKGTPNANLSKSSSLSSLKKLIPSRTLRKSTSSLNKSYISSESKTTSILNNPPQINLKGSQVLSRSKKLKIDEDEKREKGESDSENSTGSKRLRTKSKNTSSSDSLSNEDNSMVAKRTNCNQISTANKDKDVSILNTSKISLRNIASSHSGENNPVNKVKTSRLGLKSETPTPNSKSSRDNVTDSLIKDNKNTIEVVTSVDRTRNNQRKTLDKRNSILNNSNNNNTNETVKRNVFQENLKPNETRKRARQTIENKSEESPSSGKTVSPISVSVSNSSSTNTSEKSLCYKSPKPRIKKVVPEIALSKRKKTSRHSLDTSEEASPKPKKLLGSLRKNPALNSSDSTLSDSSSNTSAKTNSSPRRQLIKRINSEAEKSDISPSNKKLKLDSTIVQKKHVACNPPKNYSDHVINEDEIRKAMKGNGTYSKRESDSISVETPSKGSKLESDLKTTENESKKAEKLKVPTKTAAHNKEGTGSEVVMSPKTRGQVSEIAKLKEDVTNKQTLKKGNITNSSMKNNRESGKGGVFETYLKFLTKKLNFMSVKDITDISLYDLDEVSVSEKFDLQCRVVSHFVLVEEGIQVIRVEDGTPCKYGSLRIPQGLSWDTIVKEILENPIVEEKSRYIDIIIFNYYRLDIPVTPEKFFRINNIMALKFQLIKDPRQKKKSGVELFFCVEGQDANVRKLYSSQVSEMMERLTGDPHQNRSPDPDDAKAKDSVMDSDNFKLPHNPKLEAKSCMTSNKSPLKFTSTNEESDLGLKKKKLSESDSDVEPLVISERGKSPVETESENKAKKYVAENLQTKINTTDSSDETTMGQSPPLLRKIGEIGEIIHEGLTPSICKDVHLKNSGSEVTYSQFCEAAKLKCDNFRTSTQNEADKVSVEALSDPPDVISEDTNKMEPLVYCPSGSSASSAANGTPNKEKTCEIPKSPRCSDLKLHIEKVKTTSDLKSFNSESHKVNNDNTSDLSNNSSSIKVISSSSSEGINFEVLNSKENKLKQSTTTISEVQSSTMIAEVELVESPEVKDSPSDIQEKIQLPRKTPAPVESKGKESESVLGDLFISGNISNKEHQVINEIEVLSDSSNASLLAAENNTTMKPMTSFNASVNSNDDLNVQHFEEFAKRIPDRCFYKASSTVTLKEHELDELCDDENSPEKYLSYCHNRGLPTLTFNIIEKLRKTNSVTMTIIFVSISPSFTDLWKGSCIKARCTSCDKLYGVSTSLNDKSSDSASAIVVGSHVVCPESQCCNQILETPEFHFTVELKLEDGTPLTALLTGHLAEQIFGCSAQEALKNETALELVSETLQKITKMIRDKRPTKVVVTREDICDPTSGPLLIASVYF